MAFEKTTPQGQTTWAEVTWNESKKNPKLPFPNLRFYDKETGTISHLLEEGDRGQVRISGRLVGVSPFFRMGYNDKQNNSPEPNELRLRIAFKDDNDPTTYALSVKLLSDTQVPQSATMQLLNLIHAFSLKIKSGEIPKETPVQLGLYRKVVGDKVYPAMTLRLPSGQDEQGSALFDDPKNTVHAEDYAPRGKEIIGADGKPIMTPAGKAYDYTEARAWIEKTINEVLEVFGSQNGQDDHEGAEMPQDDPADLGAAAEAAVAQAGRPRAA